MARNKSSVNLKFEEKFIKKVFESGVSVLKASENSPQDGFTTIAEHTPAKILNANNPVSNIKNEINTGKAARIEKYLLMRAILFRSSVLSVNSGISANHTNQTKDSIISKAHILTIKWINIMI